MNHTVKSTSSAKAFLLFVTTLAFFALLVYRGEYLSDAAYDSLLFAAQKLVPSMFLFAVATGLATFLQSPSQEKKLPLLSLPSNAALTLAIGLFSGFPMGAYAARRLYERGGITKKNAEHLAAFANNASFAFLYFTVSSLFLSKKAGLLLFFSQTAASLLVGILLKPRDNDTMQARPSLPMPPLATILSEAIVSASHAMLTLAGYLTLFGALAKALNLAHLPAPLYTLLIILTEPTAAMRHLATLPPDTALPLAAFALGFSGASILLQSLTVFKGELPLKTLLSHRTLIGLFSALITLFLQHCI